MTAIISGSSPSITFSDSTTQASASAMTLINTVTASSTASVAFTNLTAYKTYKIIITAAVPATNATQLLVYFSTDNGATYITGSNTYYYLITDNSGGSGGTLTFTGGLNTFIILTPNGQVNGSSYGGLNIEISLPNFGTISNQQPIYWIGSYNFYNVSNQALVLGNGQSQNNALVNAIKLQYNSGNIASGTFKLYGLS
jgi:hypothetical protein